MGDETKVSAHVGNVECDMQGSIYQHCHAEIHLLALHQARLIFASIRKLEVTPRVQSEGKRRYKEREGDRCERRRSRGSRGGCLRFHCIKRQPTLQRPHSRERITPTLTTRFACTFGAPTFVGQGVCSRSFQCTAATVTDCSAGCQHR